MDLDKYFKGMRFSPAHHLGLGDIRITMGQQDEILEYEDELLEHIAHLEAELAECKEAAHWADNMRKNYKQQLNDALKAGG